MINGFPIETAIWCCPYMASKFQGIGPAEPPRYKLDLRIIRIFSPGRIHLFPDQPCIKPVDPLRPLITQGISSAVPFTVEHHLAYIFPINIIPIQFQLPGKGFPSDFPFLLYPLLTCCKTVCHCPNSSAIHTHIKVHGAFCYIRPFFHRSPA